MKCQKYVQDNGYCELPERHHGPCTSGMAQEFHAGVCPNGGLVGGTGYRRHHKRCHECDVIDAREMMRLASGGALRPLQREPGWMHGTSNNYRERVLKWAARLSAE